MELIEPHSFKIGDLVTTKLGAGRLLNAGLDAVVIALGRNQDIIIGIQASDMIWHVQGNELIKRSN